MEKEGRSAGTELKKRQKRYRRKIPESLRLSVTQIYQVPISIMTLEIVLTMFGRYTYSYHEDNEKS
jgi:hypothetical protein